MGIIALIALWMLMHQAKQQTHPTSGPITPLPQTPTPSAAPTTPAPLPVPSPAQQVKIANTPPPWLGASSMAKRLDAGEPSALGRRHARVAAAPDPLAIRAGHQENRADRGPVDHLRGGLHERHEDDERRGRVQGEGHRSAAHDAGAATGGQCLRFRASLRR